VAKWYGGFVLNTFTMNLYKIIIKHFSVKDSEESIACLLLAEDDEQVYEWIKSEPKNIGELSMYNSWKDDELEEEGILRDIYNDDYEKIGTETYKEWMIRIKGELNDDDFENADAYYGNTIYGWSLLKQDCNTDYKELIELGIMFTV